MLITAIWPIFALICLGFVLRRSGFPSDAFWPAAERLNYFVLFPALLFSSLAAAPVRDPQVLRLGGAALATILIASAAMALARRVRPSPAARFGPGLQGVIRFNTYLGVAVLASVGASVGASGASALAAVYLAVAVPLVNVLSILALSGSGAGGRRGAVLLLRTIFRNPLILACLAGIAVALSGVGLPFGTGSFMKLLAQGSLPLGLLCVGAALQPEALRKDLPALAGVSLLRLLCMPALAVAVAALFGLETTSALVLVVFSAVPSAPTAYVLTRQLGGDGPYMAGIITGQTLLSVLTLPLVLWACGAV
ncbi:AEC family transporter [Salipiger sp. PrR002]|uniref:AEC family transporter n=1 Tax=Salipiger sp. PrR002 TaxID=2706489 RepID=UPI0013BDB6F0|nr:AEC family transporter [Salipiger sp. PrR002]NDW02072.1 AEC family transporter [Salipiger sp. PrR002]NDW59665.1 AEC family transporter [Salipiger sp. PrR004]